MVGDKEESISRELGEGDQTALWRTREAMSRHVDFVLKQWKAFNRYLLSNFHMSRVD